MPPKQVKDPKAQVRKLVRSGVRIGQWTIAANEPIAEGAFGVVVRVRRDGDKEPSAMKIVRYPYLLQ